MTDAVARAQVQALSAELAELRTTVSDLFRRLESGEPLSRRERRWQEVCRCFRERSGRVSCREADSYLQKAHGTARRLVNAGIVDARYDDTKSGKRRLYVDAGEIEQAVRARY